MMFTSPNLYACAIYGIWELDSEKQYLTMQFDPEGKVLINEGGADGKKTASEARWECKEETLRVYSPDGAITKQFSGIRMMVGIILVTNKDGVEESYLYRKVEE